MKIRRLITWLLCAAVLLPPAQAEDIVPTYSISVDPERAMVNYFDAYHGETIVFEVAFKRPATDDMTFFWQAPGMGDTYWREPCETLGDGVYRARFLPRMDTGAKVYNCFIGRPGYIYRAVIQLRMKASPGAVPSELELPRKTIDFAQVEVTNAPWAAASVVDRIVNLDLPGVETMANAAHFTASDAKKIAKNAINTAEVARVTADAAKTAADEAKTAADEAKNDAEKAYNRATSSLTGASTALNAINNHVSTKTGNPHKVTAAEVGTYNKSEIDEKTEIVLSGVNNALAKANSAQASADQAQQSAEAATNAVDNLKAVVISWNSILSGSNVCFVVTNYISGAYTLDEGKFKIKELVDGKEHEIYNSRTEIRLHLDDYHHTVFKPLLDALKTAVLAELTNKADRAWGKYTSAGSDVPETNMVYMTSPHTVFGAGLEFERIEIGEGAIHVLANHGAPQYTAGSEGTFRFYDLQRINYFGYSSTASYTLGVDASNIIHKDGLVELHIPVTMSGHPCVYWSPELFKGIMSGYDKWTQLNNTDGNPVDGAPFAVVWEQNPPEGEQVCYINVGDNPKGFFIFTVEVDGTASFETNMPANFVAGILCTNGINKVAIDWNNGSPRFVEVK